MIDPTCQLASFADTPCEGRLVRCHLIPRMDLKRLWTTHKSTTFRLRPAVEQTLDQFASLSELVQDPRTWVWGCGGIMGDGAHHAQFDGRHSKRLVIPFSSLPVATVELATDLGLLPRLERNHPR